MTGQFGMIGSFARLGEKVVAFFDLDVICTPLHRFIELLVERNML